MLAGGGDSVPEVVVEKLCRTGAMIYEARVSVAVSASMSW